MSPDGRADSTTHLNDREREALHELELGLEWLHRANGHLVAFHHNVGHAADHLATAERLFREADRVAPANVIRDDLLPRGVIDEERWSYDVLEEFQDGLLAEVMRFEAGVRERLVDGQRHVTERRQEDHWKNRSRRDHHR